MEDDHVSWLYPACSDAPEGRGKLKRATSRILLWFPLLTGNWGTTQ